MSQVILKAKNIYKYFYGYQRSSYRLLPKKTIIKAVDGVDIEAKEGKTVAIIGESGCGKTTLGCVLGRIYNLTAGEIWLNNEKISNLQKSDLKRIREKMQMVFQDPGSSLNPKQKVESIISLPLRVHLKLSKNEIKRRVMGLLDLVNLPHEMLVRHPFALSGGEKQRVGIARALALNPKILILDEPTSSLDVSVQAKILHLLENLKKNLRLTFFLVTHNLSIAKNLADHINVMYLGRIVESTNAETLFNNPLHPYTKALLSAIPVITKEEKKLIPEEIILKGELPSPANIPNHCSFFSRCHERKTYCEDASEPLLKEIENNHYVRCHLYKKSNTV